MDTISDAVPERPESLHGEEYLSLPRAKKELHQYALQHGFALTKKFVNPMIRRQDFRCAKGGNRRGEEVKRQTGTRMTECPYEVRVRTWMVQVKEPSHNHEIRSLHASGVAPRFIVASILEQPRNH